MVIWIVVAHVVYAFLCIIHPESLNVFRYLVDTLRTTGNLLLNLGTPNQGSGVSGILPQNPSAMNA